MKLINQLLTELVYTLDLNPICPANIIPYYYGKVKEDIGISAFVILDGGHVTIHTFPLRECYFVDVFSTRDFNEQEVYNFFLNALPFSEKKSKYDVRNRLVKSFEVGEYDSVVDFGPHVMAEIECEKPVSMEGMFDFLEKMAVDIDMDPITRPYIIKSSMEDPNYLSGIIVIAQSHISLHYDYKQNKIYADIFSCAPFYFTLLPEYFAKFGKVVSNQLVSRGTKHIYLVKSNVDKDALLANTKWQKVSKYK
jgi:S-adenosylmethionine/arginine decarboxylase-like enzyme